MTRLSSIFLTTIALLGAIALGLSLAPGCTSLEGGPPTTPARAWVEASRAVHDVVAPRFTTYLQADTTLDPVTRANLERTVSDWEFMIRQAEAVLAPPAPSPAPAPAPSTGTGG